MLKIIIATIIILLISFFIVVSINLIAMCWFIPLSIFTSVYIFGSKVSEYFNKIFKIDVPRFAKFCTVLIFISSILLPAAYLGYKERNSYQCLGCLSKKHEYQWRFGSWGGFSLPLSEWSVVKKSHTYQDFRNSLLKKHAHEWVYAQGSPYYFFGTMWMGCAIGRGRHRNNFAISYESYDRFRIFIKIKIEKHEVNKKQIYQLIIRPGSYESTEEEYKKQAKLSSDLQKEFFDF